MVDLASKLPVDIPTPSKPAEYPVHGMPVISGLLWRLRFTLMWGIAKVVRDAAAFSHSERHASQLAHNWFIQLVEGSLEQAGLRQQPLAGLPYLAMFGMTPSACATASVSGHVRFSCYLILLVFAIPHVLAAIAKSYHLCRALCVLLSQCHTGQI